MSARLNLDLNWLASQLPELSRLQPLNSGAFKVVYAASHQIHQDVVLKLFPSGQETETIRRELLAVNLVNSPRVPRIMEVGAIDVPNVGTCVWFIEQRVNGPTLRQLLSAGPLQFAELMRLGLHTLEALVDAEQSRIVHRDVKPENIMRDSTNGYWLLDFGIARHLTLDSLTATSMPFGKFTLGYAPPEQVRNVKPDIDLRADLFALGVTLHECATGVNLFLQNASDDLEKLKRVEQLQLPRLTFSTQTGSDFADLVTTLTQKRRHHRPQTVAEAYAWLKDIASRENVS